MVGFRKKGIGAGEFLESYMCKEVGEYVWVREGYPFTLFEVVGDSNPDGPGLCLRRAREGSLPEYLSDVIGENTEWALMKEGTRQD